ncbi:ABC-type antimicrobial peptide transport system, permease component [Mucilaginibacter mallensis]|uniref:ABC-type antimicrobial peptide transport system, permease component n=1 Tax=Mucilaginibacter mallensis TaxID=652787 RepID=A0A1H1Z7M8_MUCMA|nr:FtsX-like permease family protein [Mucilaginibacter mallensis]SDT29569.1 ABC-type antimicrobial peptide transport system, permease component [Mucilaginibacter mallensis]
MIKNYFKIAFRGFWRHKLFTLINVIGLSIGISAALVIYLIVHFDFTFDKFQPDNNRIYRVVTNYSYSGEAGNNSGVCGPLPEAVKSQVTGVEVTAAFYSLYQPNVFVPGIKNVPVRFKNQDNVVLADAQYFKIVNYKWLAGSAATALSAPNQVVLTSNQAKKYFPTLSYDQIMGKVITYDTLKTAVTGIVQTISDNTDFAFHDFISYSTNAANKDLKDQLQLTQWTNTNSSSQLFIKLSAQSNAPHVEKQLNDLLKKNSKPSKDYTQNFSLQPLSDLHFNEAYGNFDGGRTASKTTLYGLLAIAAFLLVLGCINFVNLTTAQATQRAKEIGIRKTMGSSRRQLIFQFLSETFFITLIAVIISVAITPLILKLFADFIPAGIKVDLLFKPGLVVFLVILTVVVSILSGFYPAILLSGYKPVTVLKNQAASNSSKTRSAYLRKSLTVTQFIIAQFFIMATILVSKQIYYALHKDLGFKKDAIIIISTPWKALRSNQKQVFLNKLHSIPQVAMVSVGGAAPSAGVTISTEATYKNGKHEIKTDVQQKFADENYLKVYHIKLLAGRNLQQSDTTKGFLINETYAKVLGFKSPAQAVGNFLDYNGTSTKMQIVGVVADFYQKSLRTPIKPIVIVRGNGIYNNGTFHIALKPETAGGGEWKKAIAQMGIYWKESYPDDDFDYQFFDDNIKKFYESEQHTSTLLAWATGLSIFISCLGLLGLAIYTTNQRTKEIGVRKVLGASVAQIVTLLSTEMILLILLAFIIVTPATWWAMNKWMQSFADRTSISWWIFAASGAGMLILAVFTSGFQTVKAAVANPVKSLRSE